MKIRDEIRRPWLSLAAAACIAIMAADSRAQPAGRSITIIVPYTAGENTPDIVARIVASEMNRRDGRRVIVDNRPGASGNIGTQAAARAAPDGNTLLVATSAFVQNAGLYRNLSYDPVRSFAPIVELSRVSMTLAVHPSLPARSARDLVRMVHSRPGQVNYGSPGTGTPHHLAMELFKLKTNAELTHIPYRGTGPVVQDLLGGNIAVMFMPLPVSLPLYTAKKIRLIAIASSERVNLAPELPTLREQGIDGVEFQVWIGLLAPAGTPREIVARYNADANEILRSDSVSGRFAGLGIQPVGGKPEHFGDLIEKDLAKWLQVVKAAGIEAQ